MLKLLMFWIFLYTILLNPNLNNYTTPSQQCLSNDHKRRNGCTSYQWALETNKKTNVVARGISSKRFFAWEVLKSEVILHGANL